MKILPIYFFLNCSSLQEIDLPDALIVLQDYCFYGCTSLCVIKGNMPNSKVIDKYCFYGCSSLISFQILSDVTKIPCECFSECSSLSCINIFHIIDFEKGCFNECSMLEVMIFSKLKSKITMFMFRNCVNLKKVLIPESLNEIELNAFCNCILLK
jgi:hypothetical protein